MSNVSVITVTRGTSVDCFFQFTKPTPTSAVSGGLSGITTIAADPTTVTLAWRWNGGVVTTWVYTSGGGSISKLATGLYVATISTRAEPSGKISGTVTGTGAVTASGQFSITVKPLTVPA